MMKIMPLVDKWIRENKSYQDPSIKVLLPPTSSSFQEFIVNVRPYEKSGTIVVIHCSSADRDLKGNDLKALFYKFMPNRSLEARLHPTLNVAQNHHMCKLDQ